MTDRKLERKVKIAALLLIALLAAGCLRALEYASQRILISKNILSPGGQQRGQSTFGTRLSLWSGGLDNTESYAFTGYNDSLLPGARTYTDQYGFDHGDSLPLHRDKSPGTIRIVLTGGSGMKGSLQTWSTVKMYGYPEGTYDYTTSIAGKLRRILSTRYPSANWEVINAAVVQAQFNQGLARYYEKIHDIHPDIIINMDGYNDDELGLDFKDGGDPYTSASKQGTDALNLEMLHRAGRWGYTSMLICYYLIYGDADVHKVNDTDLKGLIKKTSIQDAWHMAHQLAMADSVTTLEPDSLLLIVPYMKKNMDKQLWLVASWENQLRHDSVYSIYCYQPILARQVAQKTLSVKEQALLRYINHDGRDNLLSYDSTFLRTFQGFSPDLIGAFAHTGVEKYQLKEYYHRYFINDYISPMTDSIVQSYGGAYVDLGHAMEMLGADVEFYMDYTHTTPMGNQFIAEQMAAQVARCPRLKGLLK